MLDDVAAMKALGTHRTLMLAALEAANVGNPRQRFSYLTVTSITLAASFKFAHFPRAAGAARRRGSSGAIPTLPA